MTFITFWIIATIIAAVELIAGQWWSMKHDPDEKLTLQELLVGIFLAVCPLVQVLVIFGMTIYFFSEIAPKIVLFGGHK